MVLLTIVGLLGILASSFVFINAVERLGEKLGLTRFAVGAVLIAFLTALPETSIALVSPLTGSQEGLDVGEATIIGAPSITILLGVPLVAYLSKGKTSFSQTALGFNYRVFAIGFPIAAVVGLVVSQLRVVAGPILLAIGLYLAYVNTKSAGVMFEAEEPLYLSRWVQSENLALTIQLAVGLTAMLYSAETFADALAGLADPFVYSVVISPFGTCMQEVVAAVLLALKGKGDVGIAVLAGENVIQATIVSGVGMLVTPWTIPLTGFAVAIVFASVGFAYSIAPRTMRFLGIPAYFVYVVLAAVLA